MQGLWDFFTLMDRGGFVMWPLLAISLVGLAVALERSWGRDHQVAAVLSPPDEGKETVGAVEMINPLEALRPVIEFMESGFLSVKTVQILDQSFHSGVLRILEQMPGDAYLMIPLLRLPDLSSLEKQFLARMREHPGEKQPQICELLPASSPACAPA